jgi:hypothetical protein
MSAHQNPISEQSVAPAYEFIRAKLLRGKVIPFLQIVRMWGFVVGLSTSMEEDPCRS